MTPPAPPPPPPYFAVIFMSVRTVDDNGYAETAQQMLELASEQPGFLGFESARQAIGISVSYWQVWRQSPHGRKTWPIARRRVG